MITFENEYVKVEELTVTELKQRLIELEEQGYGDYIVNIGYDNNSCYTSATSDVEPVDEHKAVFFRTADY